MPRQSRLDSPGVLHHVIIRGIERKKIFWNEGDQKDFVERLAHLVPDTESRCYAWALLNNHAHFLFRSGLSGISTLMKRLLTGYAVSFNRRHNRHGHPKYMALNRISFFQRDAKRSGQMQGGCFAIGRYKN